MKKLLNFFGFELFCLGFMMIAIIIGLMSGCAKTMFHKDYFDPATGKVIASVDLTMSKPIFTTMSAGINGDMINMNSGTSVQLEQLFAMGLQGYAKYMSGGLANTSTPTIGPTINPFNPVPVPIN